MSVTLQQLKAEWYDKRLSELGDEQIASFCRQIKDVKSDWELADWRYEFGKDRDPKNSHWVTRYINREITRRKQERIETSIRQRFYITTAIALGALVIALVVAFKPSLGQPAVGRCESTISETYGAI